MGALRLILSTLLGLPWASAFATTVVVLLDKHHHRIVLADDGIIGHFPANTTQTACKLIVLPDCAFAMAGFLARQQPYFSLQELGENACAFPGNLKEKADKFLDLAGEPVTSIAQYLRENDPQFYADTFHRNGGEFAYVVFAGAVDGHPVAYARGFKIARDGTVNPVSNDVTATGATGFFAGFNDHIAAYLKAHPKWSHKDTIDTTRMLMQLEIAAHPDSVGEPISILTVDRKGKQHWVQAGVCPAIPPAANDLH